MGGVGWVPRRLSIRNGRQADERQHTRPEQAAFPHTRLLSTYERALFFSAGHLIATNLYGG
jgi:hypothetical protein